MLRGLVSGNVYIATSLNNREPYEQACAEVEARGGHITVKWTDYSAPHEPGMTYPDEEMESRCIRDLSGVGLADCLIAILPGGRGTHVEIGFALAREIPVLILGAAGDFSNETLYPCAFYHHPNVTRHAMRKYDPVTLRAVISSWLSGVWGTDGVLPSEEEQKTANMGGDQVWVMVKGKPEWFSFMGGRALVKVTDLPDYTSENEAPAFARCREASGIMGWGERWIAVERLYDQEDPTKVTGILIEKAPDPV